MSWQNIGRALEMRDAGGREMMGDERCLEMGR